MGITRMVGAIEIHVEIVHVKIALILIPPQLSKLDHPSGTWCNGWPNKSHVHFPQLGFSIGRGYPGSTESLNLLCGGAISVGPAVFDLATNFAVFLRGALISSESGAHDPPLFPGFSNRHFPTPKGRRRTGAVSTSIRCLHSISDMTYLDAWRSSALRIWIRGGTYNSSHVQGFQGR